MPTKSWLSVGEYSIAVNRQLVSDKQLIYPSSDGGSKSDGLGQVNGFYGYKPIKQF
jgi:hypothetical protein